MQWVVLCFLCNVPVIHGNFQQYRVGMYSYIRLIILKFLCLHVYELCHAGLAFNLCVYDFFIIFFLEGGGVNYFAIAFYSAMI